MPVAFFSAFYVIDRGFNSLFLNCHGVMVMLIFLIVVIHLEVGDDDIIKILRIFL